MRLSTAYSRRKRWLSYMAWVRALPCCLCSRRGGWVNKGGTWSGVYEGVEAAHTGPGAAFRKPDDRGCIPLCGLECHREGKHGYHRLTPEREFFNYWKIDRPALVRRLNAAYKLKHPDFEVLGDDEIGD